MNRLCRLGLVGILVLLIMPWCYAVAPASEVFHRSFWQPYYHGQRLNYCSLDGQHCGMEVASRYCQMMGYSKADQQIIANNVGLTNYLGTTAKCTGWQCNGFKTIRCAGKISQKPPKSYHYRLRRFVLPRFDNYRVDWCYDGSKGCGRHAAFSFCRRMGYMDTRHYTMQGQIEATKAIGNQKLCFGKECRAFGEITCFR